MSVSGYSRLQIALHWIVALLVVGQFVFHEGIEQAFEAALEAGVASITPAAAAHMGGGAVILGLMLWRVLLRREHGAPPPPEGEPKPFQLLGKLAHGALYVLLIAIPLGGVAAWTGLSETAAGAHGAAAQILFLLVVLHIAAVGVHQVIWKTGLLTRMIRPAG